MMTTIENGKLDTWTPQQAQRLSSWVPEHFDIGSWDRCFYCGQPPNCSDHVIPWAFLCSQRRNTTNKSRYRGLIAPACHQCNGRLSDHYFSSMTERCRAAQRFIRQQYARLARAATWTDQELLELSPVMRDFVLNRMEKSRVAHEKTFWQITPEFIQIFDDTWKSAKAAHPFNIHLQAFLEPPWINSYRDSPQNSENEPKGSQSLSLQKSASEDGSGWRN